MWSCMNLVRLLPVGKVEPSLIEGLRAAIPQRFKVRCDILSVELEPGSFYHPERQQYHSSEILARMQAIARPQGCHLLGITGVDLYIPILKYIFGEAQVGGPCAIVSFHRLRQEFYGLDRDDKILSERLLKECIHELGHTLDLRHCRDYRCAMASAHAVEWIDLREIELCESCSARVQSRRPAGKLRAIYKGFIP